MAGTAFILLAVFYLVIDVISWWSGAPFKYPGIYELGIKGARSNDYSLSLSPSPPSLILTHTGMNSILVYVGSEILQEYFPFSWKQQNHSHTNLLLANLVAVTLWIIIAYYWFAIGFFIKI